MKDYKKDHCPECGAKYAVDVADWTCPVCETVHPEKPRPELNVVKWPVEDGPTIVKAGEKWVYRLPVGSWYDE